MDAREAAARWVEQWTRGWSAHDPEPILSLYAPGAFFRSHPFREPGTPEEYIRPALADEESVEFEFDEPIVDGDRAAIEYHARSRLRSGGSEEYVGVSLVRFDPDGRVVEQRDVWTLREPDSSSG
jgi:hypothetical protein